MKYLRQSILALLVLTLITGLIYPLFIYLIGKSVFPYQANGSLIVQNGQIVGSQLIGQQFSQNKYFWSRPSATASNPYNALASGGSNLGPLNPQLLLAINGRVNLLRAQNTAQQPIPVDLVTASGSGLDPEISLAAAYYQMQRVSQARHIGLSLVQELIDKQAKYPSWYFFGEPRVNVLELNLALDNLKVSPK